MRHDSRLSRMLHVLIHMASEDTAITSEQIGRMLGTNAAVVRRTMAGMREAGLVVSGRGPGGGWRLNRPLAEITLAQVYEAIDSPALFALGFSNAEPECLVEQEVNQALERTLAEARERLLRRFAEIRLSDILEGFDKRVAALR
ncbi:Rrf2 family transcriptional regulator [Luteibacter anthropi]|uniref:Rrf2 family transcriptional regulator n=2 Tax=Luteibacter anthropi TaxID=564369 RepID=A0A7X5U8E6_9GAMM|nr:Rrf2 family transcriptional regulator [Luteibacter anthropi]NII05618.1 Rrf2 family transcriptional regulator [Luteibacter anthropi]URX61855.1 Rrf2 family transcriptional regulator [Luteibacter anthropi]